MSPRATVKTRPRVKATSTTRMISGSKGRRVRGCVPLSPKICLLRDFRLLRFRIWPVSTLLPRHPVRTATGAKNMIVCLIAPARPQLNPPPAASPGLLPWRTTPHPAHHPQPAPQPAPCAPAPVAHDSHPSFAARRTRRRHWSVRPRPRSCCARRTRRGSHHRPAHAPAPALRDPAPLARSPDPAAQPSEAWPEG